MKRRHWIFCFAFVFAGLATWAISPWYQLHLNMTPSLPGQLYFVDKTVPAKRGDIVAVHWKGGAGYEAGATFLKMLDGVEGDPVKVVNRDIYVHDRFIAHAVERSRKGTPMEPIAAGVIPPGRAFVATGNKDGFDSRYAIFGTIERPAIIGVAHEIF